MKPRSCVAVFSNVFPVVTDKVFDDHNFVAQVRRRGALRKLSRMIEDANCRGDSLYVHRLQALQLCRDNRANADFADQRCSYSGDIPFGIVNERWECRCMRTKCELYQECVALNASDQGEP